MVSWPKFHVPELLSIQLDGSRVPRVKQFENGKALHNVIVAVQRASRSQVLGVKIT